MFSMGLSSSIVGVGTGIEDAVKTMKICCSGDTHEESEWLERQDHPLLNNLILGTVFKHLRKEELKESRLVCKTWNILTIPFTRKEFHFFIYRSNSYYAYKDSWKEWTVEKFIECFSSNKLGIPFGRFTLGSFCTTDGVGQKFLQMCGPTISSLQFVEEDHFVVEDVSEILRSTPSLEILRIPNRIRSREGNTVKLFSEDSNTRLASLKTLIVKSDFPGERDEFCPTFLEELITVAPNISCLLLNDSSAYKDRYTGKHWRREDSESVEYYGKSSSLQLLSLFEKFGRESSIQSLTILYMDREESELIDLLLKMSRKPNGLKLRSFYYYRSNQSEYTDKLIPLVSYFNDTLENLYFDPPYSSFMHFKKIHRLTRLTIYWPLDLNSRLLNFSKIFPDLEELNLKYKNCTLDQEYDEFFPESEPCPNMKSLMIYRHRFKINGFKQIVRNFPNLTKLEMSIKSDGVEILRQIWSQLTRLKYLDINGAVETNDSLDFVLTGISTLAVHEMRDALKNIHKRKTALERMDMISKIREQYCRFPSITNLTDLRMLKLQLRGEENGGVDGNTTHYITDLTGYLGLYSMKRLKCIGLEYCEFTKTCRELLIKDMELEAWTFWMHKLECVIGSDWGIHYYGSASNLSHSFKSFIPCLNNTN